MLPNIADYDASYEGEKQDYEPVADPTTDRSANAEDEAFSDVSCMTRMCPRAYVTIDIATNAIVAQDAVWGNGSGVAPTLAVVTSGGAWTITWPATITDPRGNPQSVNLRFGLASVLAGFTASCFVTGPNTAAVTAAGSATGSVVAVVF
jgi:hypothetical protein